MLGERPPDGGGLGGIWDNKDDGTSSGLSWGSPPGVHPPSAFGHVTLGR